MKSAGSMEREEGAGGEVDWDEAMVLSGADAVWGGAVVVVGGVTGVV